jgi:two-component system response regulator AtoC
MQILLVDDDAFLRDMYAMKFEQCGHDVDVADGPAAAFRILEQKKNFDVILLDMIMPAMTGVELIEEIRSKFPDVKAKCIVLSNQGQQEDIDEAMEVGAVGYIIKAEEIPSDVVKKVEKLSK